jgi:hypothetical protein
MFKYNSLSDLKDGTLVIPLRKEGSDIICQTENGIIVSKLITDFDFIKKPEEREFILGTDLTSKMEEDLTQEEKTIEKEIIVNEVIEEEEIIIIEKEEIIEPIKVSIDNRLPSNISGRNIKVSIETQRIK